MQQLLADIDRAPAISPTLWWLGRAGFAIKYHHMVFYVDPFDSPLLDPAQANHAQMLLATSAAPAHMDLTALKAMLAASPEAKLVLPKSTAEFAKTNGIGYERMTTTDNGLRVEYFGMGDYMRVYAVPSARLGPDGEALLDQIGEVCALRGMELRRVEQIDIPTSFTHVDHSGGADETLVVGAAHEVCGAVAITEDSGGGDVD